MGFFSRRKEEKEKQLQQMRQDLINSYINSHDKAASQLDIPEEVFKVVDFMGDVNYQVWIKDSVLYVFRTAEWHMKFWSELDQALFLSWYETDKKEADSMNWLETIPLSNIKYFKTDGEIEQEIRITGGGGGGSSIGRAVASSLIAGEVGASAIIASRKEIEPIRSETITYDCRGTTLFLLKLRQMVNAGILFVVTRPKPTKYSWNYSPKNSMTMS